jgi:purine-nucleoside phosphorylase
MKDARIGIVCGSGVKLEKLLDERADTVHFREIPELAEVVSMAPEELKGQERKFIFGRCGDYEVILQCGRFHFYEGLEKPAVASPMDFMLSSGAGGVVLTCAAGGLKPGMQPGDLVAVERVRMWRYSRWDATPGMAFTDFLAPDCDFIGTYQWMHGPCYETRAEISAIQRIEAEVVGMSCAPELIRCRELGIRCGVVAVVTNSCCKIEKLSHEKVIAASLLASSRLAQILRNVPDVVFGV